MNLSKTPDGALSTVGIVDLVIDGVVHKNVPVKLTMVSSSSDLDDIESPNPGDMAATFGFKSMWQMGADGETWVAIVEGD